MGVGRSVCTPAAVLGFRGFSCRLVLSIAFVLLFLIFPARVDFTLF